MAVSTKMKATIDQMKIYRDVVFVVKFLHSWNVLRFTEDMISEVVRTVIYGQIPT